MVDKNLEYIGAQICIIVGLGGVLGMSYLFVNFLKKRFFYEDWLDGEVDAGRTDWQRKAAKEASVSGSPAGKERE